MLSGCALVMDLLSDIICVCVDHIKWVEVSFVSITTKDKILGPYFDKIIVQKEQIGQLSTQHSNKAIGK